MTESVAVPRTNRPVSGRRSRKALRTVLRAGVAGWIVLAGSALAMPALAQDFGLPGLDASGDAVNSEMLVEADELIYDFDQDRVSALGNVQIYYRGNTLEADEVTLDRKKNRLIARGGVRLIEAGGNIIEAESVDLSDDFLQGFVRSLEVTTIERTRFAAESAERTDGETTVFERGTYTACAKCADDPERPPTWQIKAKKIIHKQSERMVYYEDPHFEFFGVPIAYLPFLSHPDPSVKRKSGFLIPSYVYSQSLGFGVSVPYYWAPAPNYDVTFTVTPLSRQGPLLQTEWRHRLMNGSYAIRAAGLYQREPEAFAGTSGEREWRGSLQTEGKFHINSRWKWGWDLTAVSDRAFVKDYKRAGSSGDEAVSTVYLTGQSERNRFELAGYHFRVFQEDGLRPGTLAVPAPFTPPGIDIQDKQPIIHPVLDHAVIFNDPVAGGELSYEANLTSLTREETDAFTVLRPAGAVTRFRGVKGTFTRATAGLRWRRQFIDSYGQVLVPFASLRGDLFALNSVDKAVTGLSSGDVLARVMPSVGVEYSWPFLATHTWGTQVVEPIAQLVARPNETHIGNLPNDDAQSLVFDDTTLFDADKFSGFDRVEGGTRANLGLQYKLQINNGAFLSALIGRSIHLAGRNSFTNEDIVKATANSGLESDLSDYVARTYIDSGRGLRLGARARFDEHDFAVNRVEAQASGNYGPISASMTYAFLRAQPDLGIASNREEIQAAAAIRLSEYWRTFGAVRFDLMNDTFVSDGVGIAFDDECFSMSLAVSEDRSRFDGIPVDRTVFFRFGLRTIGDGSLSTDALN